MAIVSLLPFLYLVTRNQKVRKIVAVNALVLIVGVFVIEGTLRVISPKKIEQDKWSELLSKYAEAPKPEVDPVISEIAYGRITTDSPKTYDHRIFFLWKFNYLRQRGLRQGHLTITNSTNV